MVECAFIFYGLVIVVTGKMHLIFQFPPLTNILACMHMPLQDLLLSRNKEESKSGCYYKNDFLDLLKLNSVHS